MAEGQELFRFFLGETMGSICHELARALDFLPLATYAGSSVLYI